MSSMALAQVNPGSAAQRSVEESQSQLPVKPQSKPVASDMLDWSGVSAMARLEEIDVQGDPMRAEIEAYWQRFLGKTVTAEMISLFKTWVNDSAKAQGFMAFAQTEVDGNKLQIKLVTPRIKTLKILAPDEALAKRYLKDLSALFKADFKPGMTLDILALEQKLDAVSFSMPLELNVDMRPAGPEWLDVVVSVEHAAAKSGQILGGLVQLNNYGQNQFGKVQALGQLTLGGHLPSSRLTLTGQNSQGIVYARVEYDMPWASMEGRLHAGMATSQSEGIRGGEANSKNHSTELVIGFEKIMAHPRHMVVKGVADVSFRQSSSSLSATGLGLNRVQDHQLRLRLLADNDRFSSEPMGAEISLVLGHYAKLENYPQVPEKGYAKLDFSLRQQFNVSGNGRWYGSAKLRGQHANNALDGSNQISLGGANGVRAYSSADGLGGDGLLGTLELNFKHRANSSYGVFYDGGLVRNSQKSTEGASRKTDALQALGVQAYGNWGQWSYNMTVARALGRNPSASTINPDVQANKWRLNVALTYVH